MYTGFLSSSFAATEVGFGISRHIKLVLDNIEGHGLRRRILAHFNYCHRTTR